MSKPEPDDVPPPADLRVELTKPTAGAAAGPAVEPEPAVGPESAVAAGPETAVSPAAGLPAEAADGAVAEPAAEPVAPPAARPADPRVELMKPLAAAGPPAQETVPADPWAAPAAAAPDASADPWAAPVAPADPWAAPGSGARATTPAAPAAPGTDLPPAAPQPSGWGAVPPGAISGYQPGFAYTPAPTGTSGFAVAALVTGLFCLWPPALVLAIVALVRISKRNQRGRGMAVTGLVLGVFGAIVTLVAFIGFAVLGIQAEERERDQPPRPAGAVSWGSLRTGDCFTRADPGSDAAEGSPGVVYWVLKKPCSAPHQGEVAGIVPMPDEGSSEYPGETAVRDRAIELCLPVRDAYALDFWAVPEGMNPSEYYPGRDNWQAGDHEVICVLEDARAEHLGTVRTDRGSLNPAQLAYLEAARAYERVYAKRPPAEVSLQPAAYRAWAVQMAAASRKEAADVVSPTAVWPAGAKPKLAELAAVQLEAANIWDAAGRSVDDATLQREVRRADALLARSDKGTVEIRRELGLQTGEHIAKYQV
ncbi:DUF4190 domain-containing protein [Kitasatospora sp. NPDC002965]|uniref:DUF4190 domain-containing protein n=1 Tax=Kitasatospora sp. NPDC002965 TaxID=3154775 RepID=UPI0033A64E4F